jgi:L-histidine Nalpha-methyltransferase
MSSTTTGGIPIEVLLSPDEWARELRDEAVAGLTSRPKELAPTWFYDDAGSALFEEITRLAEYYPTRAERAILGARSHDIAVRSGADTLVELGAGTSEKTRLLLDAMSEAGQLERFVPFDVSELTLRATAEAVAEEYPGIDVHGVVGDFRRHLDAIPTTGRRLIAFLGGTIGNLRPSERSELLSELSASMQPGDSLLLGTDLVKSSERLVAAYDDASGVTAEFNKNVLNVLNRELEATFDPGEFEHVAVFDEDNAWVEMRLRSLKEQDVDVPGLGLTLHFERGEDLRTEISAKFRHEVVRAELATADLELSNWWTDPAGDYAVSSAFRG